mgnify:CR=1 FL=1
MTDYLEPKSKAINNNSRKISWRSDDYPCVGAKFVLERGKRGAKTTMEDRGSSNNKLIVMIVNR